MKLRLAHPNVGEVTCQIPDDGALTIGRAGGEVDLEVNWDPQVSRRHARIWSRSGTWWFEDLGSRNGSFVGDDRIAQAVLLTPGKAVRIGDTTISLPPVPNEEPPTLDLSRRSSPSGDIDEGTEPAREILLPTPDRIVLRFPDLASLLRWSRREVLAGATFLSLLVPPAIGRRLRVVIEAEGQSFELPGLVTQSMDVIAASSCGQPVGARVAFNLGEAERSDLVEEIAERAGLARGNA